MYIGYSQDKKLFILYDPSLKIKSYSIKLVLIFLKILMFFANLETAVFKNNCLLPGTGGLAAPPPISRPNNHGHFSLAGRSANRQNFVNGNGNGNGNYEGDSCSSKLNPKPTLKILPKFTDNGLGSLFKK